MSNQSPAEGLRQQILKDGTVHFAAGSFTQKQYSDGTVSPIDHKVQEIVEIGIDDLMSLVTAYAATVEREAELKGRIDEAEYWWSDVIPATNNAVIKRAEDRRRELYDRLAALQGPPDDNEGAPDDKG